MIACHLFDCVVTEDKVGLFGALYLISIDIEKLLVVLERPKISVCLRSAVRLIIAVQQLKKRRELASER